MWSITYKLLLTAICLVAVSCSDNSNLYIGKITDQVKFTEKTELSGKQIVLDTAHRMGIYGISVIDDILLLKYAGKPYFYYCFDRNTYQPLKEFLLEGRGFNEFNCPSILTKYDHNEDGDILVSFDETNHQTIYTTNLTSYLNNGELNLKKLVKFNTFKFIPDYLDHEEIIVRSYNLAESNVYLEILNLNDSSKTERIKLNRHPVREMFRNDTFTMTVKPDGTKVAMAVMAMNQLMILDLENRTNKIFTTDKQAMKWKDIESETDLMKELYTDIKSTDKYILVVKNTSEGTDITDMHIEVWDWNGNPVKEIYLNTPAYNIALGTKDKKLYALTENEEVWEYDLEGVI